MTEPFFSVIIPVYNREKTIAETLESVASQEFRDYEVIVVDDGSDDNTLQIVKQFAWVKLIEQPNSGPGAARNRGVAEARGKYVAFLDSDDLWFPWTLRRYHEVITSAEASPAFVAGRHVLFSNRAEIRDVKDSIIKIDCFADYYSAGEPMYWIGASSFVIGREHFLRVGGFITENVNAEDAELAMKLGTSDGFVFVTEPAMLAYRQHEENITQNWQKTVSGTKLIVQREYENKFPGGIARRRDRSIIISRHVRPVAVAAAKRGDIPLFARFYYSVLGESIKSARFRFLAGTPALALFYFILKAFRPNK